MAQTNGASSTHNRLVDHALSVLEYPQVRTRLARQCETPIGESLALALEPSIDAAVVSTLLDETREAHELIARHSVPSLARVRDFRDALRRIGKGGMGNGEELFAIADAMSVMREVKSLIKPLQSDFS